MKKITAFSILLFCICMLSACGCMHKWEEATCLTAKTCSLCQETDGEALGHNWVSATCEDDQYCLLCGEIGEPSPGHQWKALTCADEYFCDVCRTASGTWGPHVEIKNITKDPNNNLRVLCRCGHEDILSTEDLMLRMMQGKWTLRAIQKQDSLYRPDPKNNPDEGVWLEFPSDAQAIAYEVSDSDEANLMLPLTLLDFELTNALLHANGSEVPVLMCKASTADSHGDTSLMLVFGDRDYAREGLDDEAFITAALKASVVSLWRFNEDSTFIYSYDFS